MDKANLAERDPFITADGTTIRELTHPAWTAAEHQSLAEASVDPGAETAEHYHPRSEELYYFLAGEGPMRLDADEAPVAAGDCVVIPPWTPHKLWNTGTAPLILLTTDFVGGARCAPAYADADIVMTGR